MTTTPEQGSAPADKTEALVNNGDRLLAVTKKLTDTVQLLLESQEIGEEDKARLLRLSNALYDASNLLADTAENVEKRFDSLGAHVRQPEKAGRKPAATIEVDGQVIAVSPAAKELWDILSQDPNMAMHSTDIYERGFRPDVSASARQLALSGATRQLRGLERPDIPALIVTEGASRSTRYRIADPQVAASSAVQPQPAPQTPHVPNTDTPPPETQPKSDLAKRIFEINDFVTGTVSAILDKSDRPVITIREIIHHAFGESIDTPTYEALKAVLASDRRIRYRKGGEYIVIGREAVPERAEKEVIDDIIKDTLSNGLSNQVAIVSLRSILQRQQNRGYFLTKNESDTLLEAFMQHRFIRYVNGTSIRIDLPALEAERAQNSIDAKLADANIHDKKPNVGRRSSGAWR